MYWKYPFGLWFAPKKDGVYAVRHQGRVSYIGIAFEKETGKNIKKDLKYKFKRQDSPVPFMFSTKELCSVKFIPMDNYEAALQEKQRLIEKHKKHLAEAQD
jgi:excinuclease UvrABC nuclease subunit